METQEGLRVVRSSRLDVGHGATAEVPGVCVWQGYSLFFSLPLVAVLANGPRVELGGLSATERN